MSTHTARIAWETDGGDFRAGKYSRAHSWSFDGGLTVPASPSPSVVRPPLSDPAAVDPEEAFVASIASCHMLWFLDLARREGFDVIRYTDDAEGMMGRNADGRIAVLRVTLRPVVSFAGSAPSEEQHARLHDRAHDECFIANSVKTEIIHEPRLG